MFLLEEVFNIINESGLDYCVQNKYEMLPEHIPSDIDIMYRDAIEKDIDILVFNIESKMGLKLVQKIVTGYYQYSYVFVTNGTKGRFKIQLDFSSCLFRKGFNRVMCGYELLDNKKNFKNFYIPSTIDEILYVILRRTIKKDFTEEHLENLRKLIIRLGTDAEEKLSSVFGKEIYLVLNEMINQNNCKVFFDYFDIFKQFAHTKGKKNSGFIWKIKYFKYRTMSYIPNRIIRKIGISIAFLAPDGAGKSTIINAICQDEFCKLLFQKIDRRYFRPRLLKNAGYYNIANKSEEKSTNPDPHNVKLNSVIKSFARFMFYNMDFIFGNMVDIQFKKMKQVLVIFDRYYYDYLADLKRYQYRLPESLPKVFSHIIPKPNVVFILDADANVLYSRKQELSPDEINRQRKKYKENIKLCGNAVLVDVNRPVEDIVLEVTDLILATMCDITEKKLKVRKKN